MVPALQQAFSKSLLVLIASLLRSEGNRKSPHYALSLCSLSLTASRSLQIDLVILLSFLLPPTVFLVTFLWTVTSRLRASL